MAENILIFPYLIIMYEIVEYTTLLHAMKMANALNQTYEGESISNQPNLFPVEIHLFFFDVTAL